jgi:hypothetical protein
MQQTARAPCTRSMARAVQALFHEPPVQPPATMSLGWSLGSRAMQYCAFMCL